MRQKTDEQLLAVAHNSYLWLASLGLKASAPNIAMCLDICCIGMKLESADLDYLAKISDQVGKIIADKLIAFTDKETEDRPPGEDLN